jgi:hypothetical protein
VRGQAHRPRLLPSHGRAAVAPRAVNEPPYANGASPGQAARTCPLAPHRAHSL